MFMNKNKEFFTISEFARLFNINKKTLYYYDKIGLFTPTKVNEKGYRFYSQDQIYDFHVLLFIKDLRMSLEDTKKYVNNRTPEAMINLLDYKISLLDDQINELNELKSSIENRLNLIKRTLNTRIDDIQIRYFDRQYLNLEEIDAKEIKGDYLTNYLAWHRFFSNTIEHQLNERSYGQLVLYENIMENDMKPNFILYESIDMGEGEREYVKPEGYYVVGRKNGKVLDSRPLYDRLFQYIEDKGLEIVGNSYEFFIIDGTYASDFEKRILEIQIQVNDKEGS